MKKIIFITLICTLLSLPVYSQSDDERAKGFHVGFVAGGGFAINDGALSRPTPLSFNLELGYDFGNALDVITRVGYSPLIGAGGTVTIGGVAVTPPSTIHLLNFDVGIRFVPFQAKISPYFVTLLGVYNSRSNAQGTLAFKSQTGFHTVAGFGVQFRAGKHHTFGLEMDTHFFLNDVRNISTLVFSGAYRVTF